MLYNLIKSNYIYCDQKDKRIIDSNSRVELYRPPVNVHETKENLIENNPDFVVGISAENIDVKIEDEKSHQLANDLIANATEKADQIISEAVIKANIEKMNLFEQSKRDGYSAGYNDAQEEISKIKKEYEDKTTILEQEYRNQVEEIEPTFIDIMVQYIKKLTGILVEDHKEVIGHLLHQALLGTENSISYNIKVSKEDYDYVSSIEVDIVRVLKKGAQLEISVDNNLNKNQCLIETDSRVIDCSLDIQLDNLITDLKILSQR